MRLISHSKQAGITRCSVKLSAAELSRLAQRLSRYERYSVPGYRRGRAGISALHRVHRRAVEAELRGLALASMTDEINALHAAAALPPVVSFKRFCEDGGAELEIQSFSQPQAPDPGGRLERLAGAAGAAGEVLQPQPGGRHFTHLLPESVRSLAQLQEMQPGGQQRHVQPRLGGSAELPAVRRPVVPLSGAGVGSLAAPVPAVPVPALPGEPLPDMPAGAEVGS